MKIELTKFLYSISISLDYVENELLNLFLEYAAVGGAGKAGSAEASNNTAEAASLYSSETMQVLKAAPNHAKRVAVLTNRMAAAMGMDKETVYALTHAAILHDCALAEYLSDEYCEDGAAASETAGMSTGEGLAAGKNPCTIKTTGAQQNVSSSESAATTKRDFKSHCIAGEKIISELPFYDKIRENVLYHHERPDGNGPFRKGADEIPEGAAIIHFADDLDTRFWLNEMDETKYEKILSFVPTQRGTLYCEKCVDIFLEIVSPELLESIAGEESRTVLESLIPNIEVEVSSALLKRMSYIFADITDYKSHFTWRHSRGIAEKAEAIGHFCGYSDEVCDKLYIAGALHDVGKIFIDNGILEKPGKLTGEEYKAVQNHAMGTWKLLGGIGGMEDITSWAANHHEKLDGSGYPYGKKAAELSRNDRLLACLDIYQALVEERPYKAGLSHAEAMAILNKMGAAGQLDEAALRDIDACFSVDESADAGKKAGDAVISDGADSGKKTGDAVISDGTDAEKKAQNAGTPGSAAPAGAPQTPAGTAGETLAADTTAEKLQAHLENAATEKQQTNFEKAGAEKQQTYVGETWRCPVCGYIYEGPLPDDFICPRCEQPGSIFERVN